MFLWAIVLCLPAVSYAQSLDEILQKLYKSMGGFEKISSMQSVRIMGKSEGGGGGKRSMKLTIKGTKSRMDLSIQPGIDFIQAYDGSVGWNIQPWTGSLTPQPMNADDSKSVSMTAEILVNDLFSFKKTNTRLEYTGKDEIEGSDCFKIVAYKPNGIQRTYFIDVDNYLIAKIETKITSNGNEEKSEMFPGDYKQVDGMVLPYSYNYGWNQFSVEKYEFNPSLDDALFALPKQ